MNILNNNNQPLISVVMSVYNVESYIEEAILSLANQSIGFKDNVQLIIVNDGSTDDSDKICKKYADEYPSNILYIEKENGGQSSARNRGLSYVKGKYVNFMDPDDTMSENAFENAINFLEANFECIDFVCIPLYYFGSQTGLHGKYKGLGNKNKIIDLTKSPADFILSSASSFYKAECFTNLKFDEDLTTAEDTKVNLSLIRRCYKIGYVCENGVRYNYRKRDEGGSNIDILTSGGNYESLIAPIIIFESMLDYEGDIAPCEKELIVYELRSRLQRIKKDALSDAEYQSIIKSYSKWISKLETEFIVRSKWLEMIEKKVLFLNLSNRSFTDLIRKGYIPLTDRLVFVSDIFYKNGKTYLTCRYNNFNESDFELAIISADGDLSFAVDKKDVNGPYDLIYGEFNIDRTHIRTFEMPSQTGIYQLCYFDTKTNSISKIRRVSVSNRCRICSGIKDVGPVFGGFLYSIQEANIYVTDQIDTIINMNQTAEDASKRNLICRTLNNQKKYILINDRPQKAGDNGEALFKYIMENEKEEIKNNTFFVIDKSCRDYNDYLSKYAKNVVQFRSVEHLEKFINAKVIYSSHQARAFYYPFDVADFKYYADLLRYKFIWLQHGVTKDDLIKEANKLNGLNDSIVTATSWETEEFRKSRYLYDASEIIPAGFARFDLLSSSPENLITIAPTWRNELVGTILPNGHNEKNEKFIKSDFYNNYISLLSNKELIELLRQSEYRVEFVLHSGFTVYESLFDCINNDVIKLRKMDDFSYREAFSKSALFITDFSSTAFDFAYLYKPVIYFQFDEDTFFDKHYKNSSWQYRKDGFGPVVNDVNELISTVKDFILSDCKMNNEYISRVDKTFLYHDRNNCKRIIEATRDFIEDEIESSYISDNRSMNVFILQQTEENKKILEENKKILDDLNYANYCLSEIRNSLSYKLGLSITTIPRKIRAALRAKNDTGDF